MLSFLIADCHEMLEISTQFIEKQISRQSANTETKGFNMFK